MSEVSGEKGHSDKQHVWDNPRNVTFLLWALVVVCVAVAAADLFYVKKIHFEPGRVAGAASKTIVVPAVWKLLVFYIIIHTCPGRLKLFHSFLKYGTSSMSVIGICHLVENHSVTVWGILRHFFHINQQNFIDFSNSRFCRDSFLSSSF